MRIGIELNGVLRDTIGKFRQVYQKHMIDGFQDFSIGKTYELDMSGNTETTEDVIPFEYGIISDVTSINLLNHFKFQSQEELYDFMYNDFTMEIFGHAGSVETLGMNDLNNFYLNVRDKHDVIIVSDEIGKSKPASLFFLSKFGCLVETIKFYNEFTINSMWDSIDVLLTANPNLLLGDNENKITIKFRTPYNLDIKSKFEISSLKELTNKIEEIYV